MRDLLSLPGNDFCADCGVPNPDWTSINLGVFLCIKCAGFHRNLGVHHSKVRSVDLDSNWDDATLNFMRSVGNTKAREIYEHWAPLYYVRPSETESTIVRENWIRAKYVRKEFVDASTSDQKDLRNPALITMPEPSRQGWLSKTNPKNVWQKRWFILHGPLIYYFADPQESYAKNSIDLREAIKVTVPEIVDFKFRFAFNIETPSRVFNLCAEENDDMFGWVHAIRRAIVFYKTLKKGGDEGKERPLDKTFTFSNIGTIHHQGELTKQGGSWKSWNKRWCVLSDDAIYYFKTEPQPESTPEGVIYLEKCDLIDGEENCKKKFSISIISHGRVYFLAADNAADLQDWKNAIQQRIEFLTPREVIDFRSV